MNSQLARLHPYPFQKLAHLIDGVRPAAATPIVMSIGEPRHRSPPAVLEALRTHVDKVATYPSTRGTPELRQTIAAWATRRFQLNRVALDPERHVLPCSGTREALFAAAQAIVDPGARPAPIVIMPNPFYQIYEGAALLAGGEPCYINVVADGDYRMDFDRVPDAIWRRTQLVYICSPGNPTGAVMGRADYVRLIELAQRHNFTIAADECYSEIYFDEAVPPLGLLAVANELGIDDYRHCLVFHSLSKRSNLPGLRSGFIAGDGALMQQLFQYRTYQGCAMSPMVQATSVIAWKDEEHVRANRALYRQKFDDALAVLAPALDVERPQAGFYLWAHTPVDDETFARELYARENVLVLPGRYLSRPVDGFDPGVNRVRIALVAETDECRDAVRRIQRFVDTLGASTRLVG